MRRGAPALLLAAACGAAACGGTQLRTEAGAVDELISSARENGAQKCAPVELAMAESHHEFAIQELDEGNFYRAQEELRVAEENAEEAFRKSPRARCAPQEPPPEPKPQDRDGDGILDDEDDCPDRPEDEDGYQDEDGCPDEDNDNDGILDRDDDCPLEAEDTDGYEDADGCPDHDNDGDGLADRVDQCPDEAEDEDGFEDDDGCPDCDHDGDGVPECPEKKDKCPDEPAETEDGCPKKYDLVKVTKEKIELTQTIHFETAKAVIKRRSYPILNEVAQVMKDHPKIRVRIEGHTDSRGSNRYNLRLSRARAASVRDYLKQAGVESDRMVSEGYGERKPIADNRTSTGRAQNRRVEFVIISR